MMHYYHRFLKHLEQGGLVLLGHGIHRLILGLALGLDAADWLKRTRQALPQRWARGTALIRSARRYWGQLPGG